MEFSVTAMVINGTARCSVCYELGMHPVESFLAQESHD